VARMSARSSIRSELSAPSLCCTPEGAECRSVDVAQSAVPGCCTVVKGMQAVKQCPLSRWATSGTICAASGLAGAPDHAMGARPAGCRKALETPLPWTQPGLKHSSACCSVAAGDDGYASQADGYASASEGYFSAAESVSSLRSGRSLGAANSFSGPPRAGLTVAGRRASGPDSDSDDEVSYDRWN
jgi:hypothetical protein